MRFRCEDGIAFNFRPDEQMAGLVARFVLTDGRRLPIVGSGTSVRRRFWGSSKSRKALDRARTLLRFHLGVCSDECRGRIKLDKTHIEHNTSAVALIADMKADIDFCRSGPGAELTIPMRMRSG